MKDQSIFELEREKDYKWKTFKCYKLFEFHKSIQTCNKLLTFLAENSTFLCLLALKLGPGAFLWLFHVLIMTSRVEDIAEKGTKTTSVSSIHNIYLLLHHIILSVLLHLYIQNITNLVQHILLAIMLSTNPIAILVILISLFYSASKVTSTRILDRLFLPSLLTGPQSLAFDSIGGGPYTGVSDGRILKYEETYSGFVEFAYTWQDRYVSVCYHQDGWWVYLLFCWFNCTFYS